MHAAPEASALHRRAIDLNCDMGESYGAWTMGQDALVMPWITSANIACGFHAGDFSTMQQTVALAKHHGVAIGAHVSLPDMQGFGRREMKITPHEAYALCLYQMGALEAFARVAGTRVAHVKPHGALYNMAAKDRALADSLARAVRDFDAQLILVGLANSELTRAGTALGLRVGHEAFADRRYEAQGSLTPRREPGAVIEDVETAVAQAVKIATKGKVDIRTGGMLELHADTICIHGDRADAAQFAQRLHESLKAAGIALAKA